MEHGILVRDLKRLLNKTLKQKSFYLIDLSSLLPTDLLYFLFKNYDTWPLIRLNRLLKFNRILEFRSQTETSTNYPYFFRIVSIYTFIILIIHWNACVFFMLKKYLNVFHDVDDLIDQSKQFFLSQYTQCFYRSTLQLTTISNIDPPNGSFEKFYMIFNYLTGVLVFALIVGSVAEIIDDLNSKRRDFQVRVDGVKSYMQLAQVDKDLQLRVIKWFNHSWSNNSGMDEQLIFQVRIFELQRSFELSLVHFSKIILFCNV